MSNQALASTQVEKSPQLTVSPGLEGVADVVVVGGDVVVGGKEGDPLTFGGLSQDSIIDRRASNSAEVTESLQRDFTLIQEKAY